MKKATTVTVHCLLSLLVLMPTTLVTMPSASGGSEASATESTSNAASSSDSSSSVPATQFKTIELEGASKQSIVSISKEEVIKEFSRLFDEGKKLHTEMLATLKNLEEMRGNLIKSFREASDKLDAILQEVSFKAGESSANTHKVLEHKDNSTIVTSKK